MIVRAAEIFNTDRLFTIILPFFSLQRGRDNVKWCSRKDFSCLIRRVVKKICNSIKILGLLAITYPRV
jgi:hypothetical protein